MDKEEDLHKVTVVIAGRRYPLKVTTEEQNLIPQIELNLNNNIRSFQSSYVEKDIQDCLSILLLSYALDNTQEHQPSSTELENKVANINEMLESAI
ncbi:MAG: cell division protein ZapA [Saprospiraceae bacterium]